jgi:hypothetical protein
MVAVPATVQISSAYQRAILSVVIDSSASNATWVGPSLSFKKSAYKSGMALQEYPPVISSPVAACPAGGPILCLESFGAGSVINVTSMSASPAPPTVVLGFDLSCQQSDVTLTLPSAAMSRGNALASPNLSPLVVNLSASGGYGAVMVDWSMYSWLIRPRLRYAQFSTTAGPVDLTGLFIGAKGLVVRTTEGAITAADCDAVCDASDAGGASGGVRLSSTVGSVSVTGLSSSNCDVVLASQQAMVSFSSSVVTNALGGGSVFLSNDLGVTAFDSLVAQNVRVMTGNGNVRSANTSVSEALRISTIGGSVTLRGLLVGNRAVVQVETSSGAVTISMARFSGIASIATAGTITCSGVGFGSAAPCTFSIENGLKVVEQVAINCANNCPYNSQLSVTSQTGNIVLMAE